MKSLILALLTSCISFASAKQQVSFHNVSAEFETATEAVKHMGLGWNLGNALDANSQQYHDPTQANY